MVAQHRKAVAEGCTITEYVDIIITDIEMPLMDGLTLCRKLKEDPGLGSLPVVIYSSLVNEEIASKCQAVHADDWFAKPQANELIPMLDGRFLENT